MKNYGRGIVQRVAKVTQICNPLVPGSSPGKPANFTIIIMIPLEEIRTPYTMQPHMRSWSGQHYNRQPCPHRIAHKRQQLERWGTELWGTVDDPLSVTLLHRACEYTGMPLTDSVVEWALHFEEDVAIMHRGVLQCVCFTSPSGWIPRQRVGHSLQQIHSAVADGDRLAAASERIAHTLATVGSFRRWVWTITGCSDHNQHPHNTAGITPQSIDDLWLRTETQTTAPLGDGVSSLFWVRVDMYPLHSVLNDSALAHALQGSIGSMSDAVLDYKNLRTVKRILDTHSALC